MEGGFERETEQDRSRTVDAYIAYLRESEGMRVAYPLEKEQEMFRAIVRGDRESAEDLLNQLLGHIYYYAVDGEEIGIRIMELFVVLIRAAACGGADIDRTLNLSRRYLWELRSFRSQEELTDWLAGSLRTLTDQVFQASEAAHSRAMERAIAYLERRYALGVTLAETAAYAGYSPTYFSRLFRAETGKTFKEYLNELRLEKGRSLLRGSDLSVAEISTMLGYSDQSYFCRLFRQYAGVTPDKYRKRFRGIDFDSV